MNIKSISSLNIFIDSIEPYQRKIILLLVDSFCLFGTFYIIGFFKNSNTVNYINNTFQLSLFLTFIGIGVYLFSGQYKSLTRYIGSRLIYINFLRNILIIFILFLISNLFSIKRLTFSEIIYILFTLSFLTISWRLIIRDILNLLKKISSKQIPRVVIYGAGEAGARLQASLRISGKYKIIAFIDDSKKFINRNLNGIPIKQASYLNNIKDDIDLVLIAIPSLKIFELKKIIYKINKINLPILQVPSIDDLLSGEAKIDTLKPIKIEKLLGRESIEEDLQILKIYFEGKNICITGAGGSIGSQLCREIHNLNPSKLILIDMSEPNLYAINKELKQRKGNVEVISILGNCNNYDLIKKLFLKNKVGIVFHTAAYKHVPLVEENPISGLANNVLTTRVLCKTCLELNIDKFLLVSTDKAVRPANVMGASKRLAELIVQDYSKKVLKGDINKNKGDTEFSIVRFGNVLGSSGSVIPLFKEQISKGGPITVTHPEVIRYFMTIKEASQLVLHASLLSNGGEVFLLDMGNPVKIKDLAEQMIQLSGLKVLNKDNPHGDIEIIFTGLRPGEKLYEELLIDGNAINTSNKFIFKVNEKSLSSEFLEEKLNLLEKHFQENDTKKSLAVLSEIIPEWSMSKLSQNKIK